MSDLTITSIQRMERRLRAVLPGEISVTTAQFRCLARAILAEEQRRLGNYPLSMASVDIVRIARSRQLSALRVISAMLEPSKTR